MNLLWVLVITFSVQAFAYNKTYQSVVNEHFKNCKVEKEHLFLDKKQVNKLKEETKIEIGSSLFLLFKAECPTGKKFAYVDSHIVRTNNETVVTFVEEKSKSIYKMIISSFMEPREYLLEQAWIDHLVKRDEQKVDAITGSTLSSRALIRNKVKIRGLHKILKL